MKLSNLVLLIAVIFSFASTDLHAIVKTDSAEVTEEEMISELQLDVMGADIEQGKNGKCVINIEMPTHPTPSRIKYSTITLGVASIASIGIIYSLPEDVSNWNRADMSFMTIGCDWRSNVSKGPVWDRDNWFLNYAMHPYFGGVYYMTMRGAGYSWWKSALYSALMSTLFWEYGFEALAEVPSIQDLFLTPGVGSIMGEGFYIAKKAIKKNGDEIIGSRGLGRTALFLLDPLNEFQDIITRRRIKKRNCNYLSLNSQWNVSNQGIALGFQLHF